MTSLLHNWFKHILLVNTKGLGVAKLGRKPQFMIKAIPSEYQVLGCTPSEKKVHFHFCCYRRLELNIRRITVQIYFEIMQMIECKKKPLGVFARKFQMLTTVLLCKDHSRSSGFHFDSQFTTWNSR